MTRSKIQSDYYEFNLFNLGLLAQTLKRSLIVGISSKDQSSFEVNSLINGKSNHPLLLQEYFHSRLRIPRPK